MKNSLDRQGKLFGISEVVFHLGEEEDTTVAGRKENQSECICTVSAFMMNSTCYNLDLF